MPHGGISLSLRYHIQRALQKHPTHCAGNVSAFVLSDCKASRTVLGNSPFIFAKLCSQLCPSITLRSLQPQTWLWDRVPLPWISQPVGCRLSAAETRLVSVLLWERRLKVKAMTCAAWWLAACNRILLIVCVGSSAERGGWRQGKEGLPHILPRTYTCSQL